MTVLTEIPSVVDESEAEECSGHVFGIYPSGMLTTNQIGSAS